MKAKIIKVLFAIMMILSTELAMSQTHSSGITYEPSIVTSIFSDYQHDTYPPSTHDLSGRFGNSFGLDYSVLFASKSYGIKSGIYLLDNGYAVKIHRDEPAYLNRIDKVYFKYISVPLEFYKYIDKFYFSIGPNFNYSIKGLRELGTGESVKYENNHFALGLKTEIGCSVELNEVVELKFGVFNRLFLFAEGNMNYGLLVNLNYKINKRAASSN